MEGRVTSPGGDDDAPPPFDGSAVFMPLNAEE
jgi:hypothetical protein